MSGGLSNSIPFGGKTFFLSTTNSTNITKIKNSFGRIFNITTLAGTISDFGYLKLFNIATPPVLGVTLAQMTIPIGALSTHDVLSFDFAHGCLFNAGIYMATTDQPEDTNASPISGTGTAKIIITYL